MLINYVSICVHCGYKVLNKISKRKEFYSVGSPGDQMTRYTKFVTIISSAQGRLFRISLFIPNGICSNNVQSTQKIKLFLVV